MVDGASVRDHALADWKQNGFAPDAMPPELAHEMPGGVEHLWTAFLDLHRDRGSTGFGPAPITRRDRQAWEEEEGPLTAWEREIIRRLDGVYLAEQAEATQSK